MNRLHVIANLNPLIHKMIHWLCLIVCFFCRSLDTPKMVTDCAWPQPWSPPLNKLHQRQQDCKFIVQSRNGFGCASLQLSSNHLPYDLIIVQQNNRPNNTSKFWTELHTSVDPGCMSCNTKWILSIWPPTEIGFFLCSWTKLVQAFQSLKYTKACRLG